MRKLLKVVGIVVLAVVASAMAAASWLMMKKPASRASSTERVEPTAERLARGTYIVEHVSACLDCHSDHLTTFGIPIKPGTEGQGGFAFDAKLGVPGVVCAQNITPDPDTGMGRWTDGEILRAMREGVDRNGDALFPMMPYQHLRSMSDEDAKSVIVYLRTLKPIRHQVPKRQLEFPINIIVKFIPKPLDGPVSAPDAKQDRPAYGHYLTKIAGCYECHTPHNEKHQLVQDQAFAGGWEMRGPWGRVITANLTPHADNYMGRATREEFIARFRAFAGMNASNAPVCPKGRNTVMPWLEFAGMSDDDLGAIYDYLKTVKPIAHKVNSFPDAAM